MATSPFTDPRYEALGMTDTTQARAADAFYGSMPNVTPMNFGMGGGQFQDEDDLEVAYEMDIVRRLGQLDQTAPDYEFRVQEFLANEPDPNAGRYGRVQQAISANMGRSQLLRQNAQKTLEQDRQLRLELASQGFSPERFSEISDVDGKLIPERAAFQLGELKRTNGLSGKVNPALLNDSERKSLIEVLAPLNVEPTDQEKIMAWQNSTGEDRNPKSNEEWAEAYRLAQQPKINQARGTVLAYQQLGKTITPDILSRVGIQPSVVTSSVETQSTPTTSQVTESVTESPINPASPNLTLGQAQEARVVQERTASEQAAQQAVNQQWTQAKDNLEQRLLQQFGGDTARLNQFYRSVISDETVANARGRVPGVRAQDDPSITMPISSQILREAGIQPQDEELGAAIDRGFFSGGDVSNEEVLRSLAQDRLTAPQNTQNLPRPQSQVERDALPVGTRYITPDGQIAVRR